MYKVLKYYNKLSDIEKNNKKEIIKTKIILLTNILNYKDYSFINSYNSITSVRETFNNKYNKNFIYGYDYIILQGFRNVLDFYIGCNKEYLGTSFTKNKYTNKKGIKEYVLKIKKLVYDINNNKIKLPLKLIYNKSKNVHLIKLSEKNNQTKKKLKKKLKKKTSQKKY